MKRLSRLVILELWGPWLFGVAIFTVLIMAGSFLFQLTGYLAKGIDFATIMQLSGMLIPGIVAKTCPMAVLLACLLSFGRLSGDSEIVVLKAAGTSLTKIMVPVAAFGLAVAVLTFIINDFVVPRASYGANTLKEKIVARLDSTAIRPTSYPIFEDNVLKAMVMAKNFDIAEKTLSNVAIIFYDKQTDPNLLLTADKLVFEMADGKLNTKDGWRVQGTAHLVTMEGNATTVENAWPAGTSSPDMTDKDLVSQNLKDFDGLSMAELRGQIQEARETRMSASHIRNMEFGYWNKIAIPFAAFVYALVGAPLGIRNHRTGAATGFTLAVVIIFGYMLLTNFMAIWAQGGQIPAWVASFGPLIVGTAVALYTIRTKNS